ncbi:MAG: hypothetical protein IJF02_04980 [Oscillospiraceae bacterium]|nr:hypothetical protein [Oscillospiraceae bacterium]
MSSGYEFVYALVLETEDGEEFLAISPCGSADPKDLVLLDNDILCEVKECLYVNRLSTEFQLLEKVTDMSEVTAVYAQVWEKQEAGNGTVSGDS